MQASVKPQRKTLTSDNLAQLQAFIDRVKAGEIVPFKEKTERARKNLKKAGLIR